MAHRKPSGLLALRERGRFERPLAPGSEGGHETNDAV